MEKINFKSFIDSGWFTALMFAFGAFLGLMNSTGFFSQLGELSNVESFSIALNTLTVALLGVFGADWIRKRIA